MTSLLKALMGVTGLARSSVRILLLPAGAQRFIERHERVTLETEQLSG